MAATEIPPGTTLEALNSERRPIEEWTITFQLLAVVLDPYTYESSWLLSTAVRILENFRGSSVRVAFIVTADNDDAERFLGPWTDDMLVFVDPDRTFVRACGLAELPALVQVRQNGELNVAEGWQPPQWKAVIDVVAGERRWSSPLIPGQGDPAPYAGSPAFDSETTDAS